MVQDFIHQQYVKRFSDSTGPRRDKATQAPAQHLQVSSLFLRESGGVDLIITLAWSPHIYLIMVPKA